MKKQYFVKQLERIVEIDPVFLKAAGQMDTAECTLFEKLQVKYSTFEFLVKDLNKSSKKTYANLTYDRMAQFIKICLPEEERTAALATFKEKCNEATTKDGRYGYVKSWFLSEYKEQYNKSSFAKDSKKNTENNSTATNNTEQKEVV